MWRNATFTLHLAETFSNYVKTTNYYILVGNKSSTHDIYRHFYILLCLCTFWRAIPTSLNDFSFLLDLELKVCEVSHVLRFWCAWVTLCNHISWTIRPIEMRPAIEVKGYKSYCDIHIRYGAWCTWVNLCDRNFIKPHSLLYPMVQVSCLWREGFYRYVYPSIVTSPSQLEL